MRDDFYKRVLGGSADGESNRSDKRDEDSTDKKTFSFFDINNDHQTDNGSPCESSISDDDERYARRAFSRVGFSLSTFTAVSYAVVFIAYAIIGIFFKDDLASITGSVWFSWVMNIVSMYILAAPALYLVLRNMKKVECPKSKLSFSELVQLFLISEGVMMIGNIIGVNLNGLIGAIMGREVTNGVGELISNSPIWLVTLVAVIIGPIVEELIFRKLIIDRLSVFGDLTAVITSSLLFALFHGNLYQFFYAAALGMVLGFIYVKTRSIIYPVIIHVLVNFMGSVVAIPVSDMLVELEKYTKVIAAGGDVDMGRYVFVAAAVLLYVLLEYGMAFAGIILLVKKVRTKELYISRTAMIHIPKSRTAKICFKNAGMISFTVISVILIILNIFFV